MKKLITLLFMGLSALLAACSSHSNTIGLSVKVYNHTSKAINFNMTDATKKDWKGGELGYEWGANGGGVSAYHSTSGSGWRVPDKWDPNYTIFSNGRVMMRSIPNRNGHLSNCRNMRIKIYFIWRYTFFLMTPLKLL